VPATKPSPRLRSWKGELREPGVAGRRPPSLEVSAAAGDRLQFLSPLEIEDASVIYLAVKSWCLIFLSCGIVAFSSCATDDEFNAAEAAKTRETVPGEVNPNAPDASQQTQTKPGFRY
jgi:hypothetical protein